GSGASGWGVSGSVGSGAVGPEAVGPGTVGPGTVGPEAVGPGTVGPGTVGPEAVGPGTVGPEAVGPEAVGPGTVGPEAVGPGTVGPEAVGPGTVGPGTVGPEAVGPGAIGPEAVGPGAIGPGPVGKGPVGPGSVGSGSVAVSASSSAGPGLVAAQALPASYRIRLPDGTGRTVVLTPVSHLGSVVGVVAVLEPVGDAAVTSASRTVVGLAGRSVPWRHAVARAVELAGSAEPLLLVGERGTGKTSLARELAANPLILDAAEGELRIQVDELVSGRPLLIRHVERLAQPYTATLNSLLDSHPGVPLLVTYTPGVPPGPCLQRLLDTLAARSVTLPALRERPEDVRELATALTPRPAPGRPPLTWTLDALRALEQHPWPGNVTELAHLVRALADQRRATGPVRRAELPDPVREGPAPRPLSPMEHAERAAILEALRLHGGNKARTAAALGIARATLYRKLRGYRG
ncbi:helix-turn-helix domain-containing protein, partial [Streptomyces sp. NPDC047043]|uniref:helix-turn-helix domain-containing protein n=1 Tax=Streptomyces sp. NPDC047043 TaxID=3154497 RepID=UPI0033E177CD